MPVSPSAMSAYAVSISLLPQLPSFCRSRIQSIVSECIIPHPASALHTLDVSRRGFSVSQNPSFFFDNSSSIKPDGVSLHNDNAWMALEISLTAVGFWFFNQSIPAAAAFCITISFIRILPQTLLIAIQAAQHLRRSFLNPQRTRDTICLPIPPYRWSYRLPPSLPLPAPSLSCGHPSRALRRLSMPRP